MTAFDLAIVGSGFGGSILSMIARRLGLRVALLERGRHPRFAIGESASPLAGILIEQLADRYDLPRLRPLSAFGTWQRHYAEVGCGVKRGFTYFKHQDGRRYRTAADRSNQLLVAASPSDELSDTHWLRADLDSFLVGEATALGTEYVDEVHLDALEWRADGAARLHGVRHGTSVRVDARMVIDASGPRGFLSRALGIGDRGFDRYPGTQALFSHFVSVARSTDLPDFDADWGAAPYPADDAALHHVFEGGWMWVLRFGNGVTSAGIAVTDALAAELRLADGEPAWRRFLDRYPSIAAQFADAAPIREFTWMSRMSYRAETAAGPGWAMLPSAAGFIDPLFSTGIPLTLLGIERLALLLAAGHETATTTQRPTSNHQLATTNYAAATLADIDHTAAYIRGCYTAFAGFEVFTSYAMFYFAAASYAEMARRISGARRPARFLCADRLGDETLRLSPASGADAVGAPAYRAAVAAAIEPLNVAGLCDESKRNWYGVDLEDTVRAADKLGVTPAEVRQALDIAEGGLQNA